MTISSIGLWEKLANILGVLRHSRRSIFKIEAVCALVGFAAGLGAQAAHKPGLQELDETIGKILAADGLYSRSTTAQNSDYKSTIEQRFSVTEANGCRMDLVAASHAHRVLGGRTTDRDWSEIFKVDFANLDPGGVLQSDPQPPQATWQITGFMVRIPVTVGSPTIVASRVDKQTNTASDLPRTSAVVVYLKSREAADRLAKAFGSLATACHANPAGF